MTKDRISFEGEKEEERERKGAKSKETLAIAKNLTKKILF